MENQNQLNYVMSIISVMSQKKQSFASKPKDNIHNISCCKTFRKRFHHFLVILCVYYAAKKLNTILLRRVLFRAVNEYIVVGCSN